jgi:hypothetical protein
MDSTLMGNWPSRVRVVPEPQLRILRKLARHRTSEGSPLASQPQFFLGTNKRSLAVLKSCALVEQVGDGEFMPWALTWRGLGYIQTVDRRRK